MKAELVDHIELFKVMMEEGVATPVETFFGYTRYVVVSDIILPPDVAIWRRLTEFGVSSKYIGRYMTRGYVSVDVYGIDCDDKTAMLIKMSL